MITMKESAECKLWSRESKGFEGSGPALGSSSAMTDWVALEPSLYLSEFWAPCLKRSIIIPALRGSCSGAQRGHSVRYALVPSRCQPHKGIDSSEIPSRAMEIVFVELDAFSLSS